MRPNYLVSLVYFLATVVAVSYAAEKLTPLVYPEAGFVGLSAGLLVLANRAYRGHP